MITVHHLNFSRSTRVVWLLEELGLPYELVRYQRDQNFRAPPALKDIHPLGKAPVIQDGALVIGESAVILSHIDDRHGGRQFAPPAGTPAGLAHEEWLQYAESTAAFPIIALAIAQRIGGLTAPLDGFFKATLAKSLDHIAAAVEPGGYLTGERLTLADVQMSYLVVMANHAGLLDGRPGIAAYLERIEARPAYVRAVEVGGPMAPPTR